MENKNNFAYRAVYEEYAQYYETGEIDKIPNLEGLNYIMEEDKRCNNFTYSPDVRYLHFFNNFNDANDYLEALEKKDPSKKMVVLKFNLPSRLTKQTYRGRYYSLAEMKDVYKDEYIFPASEYDPSFFVGLPSNGDKKPINYDPDSYGWF